MFIFHLIVFMLIFPLSDNISILINNQFVIVLIDRLHGPSHHSLRGETFTENRSPLMERIFRMEERKAESVLAVV